MSIAKTLIAMTGSDNVVIIHKPFVQFTGSIDCALLLEQLLYWTPKSKMGGWIAKTYKEWETEISLSPYEVKQCAKRLEEIGVLETKVKKFNGNPTLHYRIKMGELEKRWATFLDIPEFGYSRNFNNDVEEIEETITETTTETTTDKKGDLLDGILHFAEKEQAEKKATRQFENAFGFGNLPWHSNTKWDKFRKFVIQIHSTDPTAFGEYVIWRAGDGKYKAMSNKQIRTNPDIFVDTGWPEFLAENQSDGTHSKFEGV